MVDPVLSPGAYALGMAWIAVAAGSVVTSAVLLRRALLPGWPWLATTVAVTVVALAQLTVTAQLVAAAGLLRPWPLLLALLLGSVALAAVARRVRRPAVPSTMVTSPSPPAERWAATLAIAAVGAQWAAHTADALGRGMTHPDTLWYHGPYSARFLQMGSLGDLGTLGYGPSRYFPLGSELLHAVLALPLERDLLSPLVNLAFAALAICAAAAVGSRWGAGALTALGTAMLLGLPTLAGTQPGQASNDVMAAALVLSAVALLAHSDERRVPMGIAGLALGLAVGTKVTVLALAATFALGVLAGVVRRHDRPRAVAFGLGAVVPAIAWPLRNIVLVGSPAPFVDARLGPWHNTAVVSPSGPPSLARSLVDGTTWSYRDGLDRGFGPLWPLILATFAAVLILALVGPRGRRLVAASSVVGAIAFAFTPWTGGSSFQFNLRYLTPALFLSVLVVTVACGSRPAVRAGLALAASAVVAVNLFAAHHERVDAWPGYLPVVGGSFAAVLLASRWAHPARVGRVRHPRGIAAVSTMALLLMGYPVQAHALERRYVEAGLHDDVLNAAFRTVSGATVDVLGTPETYPMFGADLSNEVRDRTTELSPGAPPQADQCRYWRRLLGRTDYVVISSYGFLLRRLSPEEQASAFTADPSFSATVVTDGERALYRFDGVLDPAAC